MTIAVGVAGLGVGEQHARAVARYAGARLATVCDLDRARADQLARELGAAVTAHVDDLLVDPAVDAVVLATYDDHHAPQVTRALAAGKHVFCEKPLCRTLDELRAIRDVRGDRHLSCNLILRAAPLYQWLRSAIRAGELGTIYAFDGDYLYGRLDKITDGWRTDVEHYSVFQGGAVHLVDLMMWLLGERPSRVTATGNRIATEGTRFRYLDFVAATYELPSTIVGRITANFASVHKHQHVVRIFGTKATFIHDDEGPRLHVQRDPGGPPRRIDHAPVAANKGDLVPSFLDAIRDGADPAPAARHEFDVITACLAADQALASRQPLTIEYA
jgi:predicted dehydrogenase